MRKITILKQPKGNGQRPRRVAEEMKRVLSTFFIEGRGVHSGLPFSSSLVNITNIRISPDLKNATVFFTILGHRFEAKEIEPILQEFSPQLKQAIAQNMRLKFIPNLTLRLDDSLEKVDRIESLLSQIKEENPSEE